MSSAAGECAAGGGISESRVDSLAHSVRAACAALDEDCEAEGDMPLLKAVCDAWHQHTHTVPQQAHTMPPFAHSAGKPDELLASVRACVPKELLQRAQAPLELHVRPGTDAAGEFLAQASVELHIDGVFNAIIAVVASVSDGSADGQALHWLPTRVSVGPSRDPMAFGASQSPVLCVYRDLCARAGAILAGLEALPARQRLGALVRWLCSLHCLFQSRCRACGAVFPPLATCAMELLPPTARADATLHPYHPACFIQLGHGTAEAAYIEACRKANDGGL